MFACFRKPSVAEDAQRALKIMYPGKSDQLLQDSLKLRCAQNAMLANALFEQLHREVEASCKSKELKNREYADLLKRFDALRVRPKTQA